MFHWLYDVLGRFGWAAFVLSFGAWLLLNTVAVLSLWRTRDRALVQRWTGWWLALNLMLVAVGIGVPAVSAAARLVVRTMQGPLPVLDAEAAQTPIGKVRAAN